MKDMDDDDNSKNLLSEENINKHKNTHSNLNCNNIDNNSDFEDCVISEHESNYKINNSCNISDIYSNNDCSISEMNESECSATINENNSNCSVVNPKENDDYSINSNKCYNLIDLAVLINTKEELSDCLFETINLPIVNMECEKFIKAIYVTKSQYFCSCLFDELYRHLKKFSLINEFLSIFERKCNISREHIDPTLKISFIRECSFKYLSEKITKIISLNKREFINTLCSLLGEDNKIQVIVTYKIFSKSLKIGINIRFRINLTKIDHDNLKITDIYYNFMDNQIDNYQPI